MKIDSAAENAIKIAAFNADLAPEPYRIAAFEVLLAYFIGVENVSQKHNIMTAVSLSGANERGTKPIESAQNFKGLAGGLNLLISEGYFASPKDSSEILAELARNAYHYPRTSLPKTLQQFMKNRILTRIKSAEGAWKYVIKK
jgi:hypothetical protein